MSDGALPPTYKIVDHSCYVKIRYRVRVADGPVLKGAVEPEIMDFVTGYGQVIPGLETRLIGQSSGQTLSFTVPPEEAFGQRLPDFIIEKSKADFHFPAGMEPYPGMEIPMVTNSPDAPDTVMIRQVREDSIVIDCNHPLSGFALQYELEILEARPARSTDVCSEWEEQSAEGGCSTGMCEIVLGQEESKDN